MLVDAKPSPAQEANTMVTDEMVEKAARAMCEAWHYSKIGTPDGDAEWRKKQDQYLKQARAALEAALSAAEPVAEIVSAHGDPEAFGERELVARADIQKFPYGTKLYATPPAPFVAVKALEWSTPHPTTTYPEWRALGLGFEAVIDKSKPTRYGKFPLRINGRHTAEKFNTLEAAKAFAQADYEARIRSALSAQVQDVAGWQSMGTAPKDGTTFIAVMAEAYSPRATLCKFDDGKFLSPSLGEKFVVPGWNQWWPTHWMALPAAPAKQEGGDVTSQ